MAMHLRFRAPRCLVLATTACLAIAPTQAAETAPDQSTFDQAMQAYERNHWSLAFDGLAVLADAGSGEAARLAWLMSRHGTTLYRARLDADPARRQRWLALAVGQAPATQLAGHSSTLTAGRQP